MNKLLLSASIGLMALTCVALPTQAQTGTRVEQRVERRVYSAQYLADLNRAKNYARQAAEKANGGLRVYRAESAMHGPADKSPFVDNNNGTWTFTFRGGRPGTNLQDIESVVTVAKNGWKTVVNYNGAVRVR